MYIPYRKWIVYIIAYMYMYMYGVLLVLQFFPDKSCQNDMKTFQVKCGCGWQGPLVEWEVSLVYIHVDVCVHVYMLCELFGSLFVARGICDL